MNHNFKQGDIVVLSEASAELGLKDVRRGEEYKVESLFDHYLIGIEGIRGSFHHSHFELSPKHSHGDQTPFKPGDIVQINCRNEKKIETFYEKLAQKFSIDHDTAKEAIRSVVSGSRMVRVMKPELVSYIRGEIYRMMGL